MSIDLRRRYVGMSQHLLHGTQVGASIEQMRREGMAQHMRADTAMIDTRLNGEFLQHLCKAMTGQVIASASRKQPWRLAGLRQAHSPGIEPGANRAARGIA